MDIRADPGSPETRIRRRLSQRRLSLRAEARQLARAPILRPVTVPLIQQKRRITAGDISQDEFLAAVIEVLEAASVAEELVLRALARAAADAVNASHDPNCSPFRLPSSSTGAAVLLHEAYLRGGLTLATLMRTLNQWDVEALLADAWETIPSRERLGYGVPVAIWSSNPDDYKLMPLNALPPPHNLWKHGHDPAVYASYVDPPEPERRFLRRRRPQQTRQEVIQFRREQFDRYVRDVQSGTVTLRGGQRWTPRQWKSAVDFAYALTRGCRPWTKARIEAAIRTRYRLTADAQILGEAKLVNILLNDPVRSAPGATQLENGQHRLFAAALAGQTHILARDD